MYLDPRDADFTAKHLPSNHPQVVQHRLYEENAKLRADLAAAQRELAAHKQAIIDARELELAANPVDPHSDAYWIGFCMGVRQVTKRVAELLAHEGGK